MSSSFKNSMDNKLTRSSRVLGNLATPNMTESFNSEEANVHPQLHSYISESTPLINDELQIHQRTAELSSIDFNNNNNMAAREFAVDVNPEFERSIYNNSYLTHTFSNNNDDLFDDANSNYFPQAVAHTDATNNPPVGSLSYNPFYKQQYTETSNLLGAEEEQPQDLESFNTLLGNTNSGSNEYFEFNQNLNNSDAHSISKASSIINFTKKINRSVSSKLLNIHSNGKDSNGVGSANAMDLQHSQPFNLFGSSGTASASPYGKLTPVVDVAVESLNLFPSVFLGLLLNVLDALSYGMIVFPISKPLFADLGPSGLSMFYVSCIVSQLIYSLGGSAFKSAIGSEMIEVTPFFHAMAISIMNAIGTDDETLVNKDAIVATTITCYCASSMLTGLTFFLLGKFKLGQLIGFFPRHILIGSIGGVGYFLIVTGLEVTSRLTTTFSYNWETLRFLFTGLTFVKWSSSVLITVILVLMQKLSRRLASFSLLLPAYFIAIFILIHFFIWIIPEWNLQSARDHGFVFDVASSPSTTSGKESWYHFWTLFKFKLVRWDLILEQLPSMLALTFFGMLHVPINVPALAISVQHDDVDLNRELIAHGYSNFISGAIGSIQNYLVYSNSLLFIRSGAGDKRLAGILLAASTAVIMFIGPSLIKFIPVCVVGSLIFLLGYELLKESLYDSYSKLSTFDYSTIIIIIVTMGLVDFVYGILLGVLIAFVSFVVENANQNPIKKIFTGEVVRSTIKRNHLTNNFLKNVGSQTLIVKLQGNIFFGSIGKIEQEIKKRFETNQNEYNFRYLILDFNSVLSVDYTAAEGFQGIKNFTNKNNSYLILSSINTDSIFKSLFNVGLIDANKDDSTQLFHDLNSALEWCENEYLISYYNLKNSRHHKRPRLDSTSTKPTYSNPSNYGSTSSHAATIPKQTSGLAIPNTQQDEFKYNLTESYMNPMSLMNNPNGFGSPRQRNIIKAITKSMNEENLYNHQYKVNANRDSNAGNLSAAINNTLHASSSPSSDLSKTVQPSRQAPASPNSNPVIVDEANQAEYSLLRLITKTFQGISTKPELFWKPLIPHLTEITLLQESTYFPQDSQPGASDSAAASATVFNDETDAGGFFFIIESGLIQLNYDFNQGKISETLVPKTAFGSLGIRGPVQHAGASNIIKFNLTRNLKITALKDSKIWKLSYESFHKLSADPKLNELANELLLVEINLLSERFDKITSFVLISS